MSWPQGAGAMQTEAEEAADPGHVATTEEDGSMDTDDDDDFEDERAVEQQAAASTFASKLSTRQKGIFAESADKLNQSIGSFGGTELQPSERLVLMVKMKVRGNQLYASTLRDLIGEYKPAALAYAESCLRRTAQ